MSGANIGTAYMTVSPRFENLGKSVNDALGNVDTTQSGVKMGKSLDSGIASGTGGFAKSGALIGAFSAATTKAMELIGSSVGGAAARLDTMNNYPKVMQTLGYSADDAQSSIQKMSDHLIGLPTALNDMTSTVQGIAAVTGDLNEATDSGLALNDMLLASGSNTQIAGAAMEQFRQMLAKGKPDMQDWKSLTSAMPGQMAQLAKAMLGPTANANDLYTALGGGGAEATISMDQLMRKMVELDTTGGDGITSFAEQAKSATGGIQSSMSNAQTAITRGLADIMDSIGTDTISGVIKGTGKAFEDGLKTVGNVIAEAKPAITGFVSAAEKIGPSLIPAAAGAVTLAAAIKGLSAISTTAESLKSGGAIANGVAGSFTRLAGVMGTTTGAGKALTGMSSVLSSAMGGPIMLAAGLAAAGIGLAVSAMIEADKRAKNLKSATEGLSSAAAAAGAPIQSVTNAYDSLTGKSAPAVKSLSDVRSEVDQLAQSGAQLAKSIEERTSSTAASVGLLETYKQTINDYANQTGLSKQQQAELKMAIDGVNDSCGTQYSVVDAANGVIADQNGTIQTNTDKLNDNIAARERNLRIEALEEDYKDTYKQQYDAQVKYNDALRAQEQAQNDYNDALSDTSLTTDQYNAAVTGAWWKLQMANGTVNDAKNEYDSATSSLDSLTDSMGDVASGADVMAVHIQTASNESPEIASALSAMGTNATDLSEKLVNAGVSSEQMNSIAGPAFANMLASCGGDINTLISMIQMYNAQPIVDKDGNVNVNQTSLIDAQGNVYTWNGTNLVGKDGQAVVDDVSLMDAQGNVVTWNGTNLDYKGTNADVDSQSVVNATNNINDYNNTNPEDKHASTIIDVIANVIDSFTGNASGGFFATHADGGFIVDRPTYIGTDSNGIKHVAGEDGAEWVAHANGMTSVVPLTNSRYVAPFASAVASFINGGSSNGSTYNIRIDGLTYNSDAEIAAGALNLIRTLQRKGAM